MAPKDLFIYHPGTGTVIALSDVVYLCDRDVISDDHYERMLMGEAIGEAGHKGFRLDNHNMTRLFFEE